MADEGSASGGSGIRTARDFSLSAALSGSALAFDCRINVCRIF